MKSTDPFNLPDALTAICDELTPHRREEIRMTTTPIPDAAVKAATAALYEIDYRGRVWSQALPQTREWYISKARHILTAALPLLSVPEADEVERLRAMVRDEADAHGMTLLKLDKAVAQVERVRALADSLRERAVKAHDDGWRETVLVEAAAHIDQALAARTPDDDAEGKS